MYTTPSDTKLNNLLNLITAVIATPTAPHQAINEEDVNSIASSPSSSQGPLSPKTPTSIKSTSQVYTLFTVEYHINMYIHVYTSCCYKKIDELKNKA